MAMERILIVGAGLTGALTAAHIRSELSKSCNIMILEKARGAGGRMTTTRSSQMPLESTCDLGAQYISLTTEYAQKHQSIYENLLNKGLLEQLVGEIVGEPSDVSTKHYVAPTGVSSLTKHFLEQAEPDIKYKHLVTEIKGQTDSQHLRVKTEEGVAWEFDTVILTMPVPQILQLKGDVQDIISSNCGVREKLGKVSYSSRYALCMFFTQGTKLDVPWVAKYVTGNKCIRFLSIDNKKRGSVYSQQCCPSLLVHTSVPFGLKHLEQDKLAVQSEIIQELKEVWPKLPEPCEVKVQKWLYSQVHHGYEGSPGCVVLRERPFLILAGDGFVHSNFDGCVESAQSVIRI
ncbi:hypothetical protein ScPMuIL_011673 [Solemya velum]